MLIVEQPSIFFMKWLGVFRGPCLLFAVFAGLASLAAAANAQPQQTLPTTPPTVKVQELIKLLDDPEICTWMQTKSAPAAADAGPATVERISQWEALIRGHFASLFAAARRFGTEMANAATIVTQKVNEGRRGVVVGIIGLLIGLGYAAEWLFRRVVFATEKQRGVAMARPGPATSAYVSFLGEAGSLLVFTLASAGLFLAFEWPPLLRQIVLTYLLALIAFRLFSAIAHQLLAVRITTGVDADVDIGTDPQPRSGGSPDPAQ